MKHSIRQHVAGLSLLAAASCSPKAATTPSARTSPAPSATARPQALSAAALYAQLEARRTAGANAPDAGPTPEAPEWPSHCRERVKYPATEPLESCSTTLLGNGSTLVLRIVDSCGGDSCSVRAWVYTERIGRFLEVPGDVGGTLAADPSGQFLIVDETTALTIPHDESTVVRDPLGGTDEIISARIALPDMVRTPFAPCFSFELSPGGRWFVCRNREGDVLRLPIAGGKPQLVVRSGVAASDLRWVPYAYGYPDAVEFPSASRLRFTLDLETDTGDSPQVREVPWSE